MPHRCVCVCVTEQMCALALFAVAIVMIVDSEGHVAYGDQVKNWGGGETAVRSVVTLHCR